MPCLTGRGAMQLTNEQIVAELQACQNAVEQAVSVVQTCFPKSLRRITCLNLLQLVTTVLRQEQQEVAFGTWQEKLDEGQIADELKALQTAVSHAVDVIATEKFIGELMHTQRVNEHDAELLHHYIAARRAEQQQHLKGVQQQIKTLRLLQSA